MESHWIYLEHLQSSVDSIKANLLLRVQAFAKKDGTLSSS